MESDSTEAACPDQLAAGRSNLNAASASLRLRGRSVLNFSLLGIFALLLFGYAGFSGRPLTMHEARLPECAREMLHRGDWLLPTSGGRPWLERPPLPHWCVIASMKIFAHDDRVWIVRLPSAVAGMITVLLTAWMAGRLFGRTTGIAAGLMLATSFEFYVYACQAEDDIYLATLVAVGMALFVRAELLPTEHRRIGLFGFVSGRSIAVLGFFALLGLTNLTKGPLLGIIFYLGGPVGIYLLARSIIERSLQPLLRYTWLWGWLVTVVLTAAWPLWAYHVYPDFLDNLKYDYVGRMNHAYTDLNEPWYYYIHQLPTAVLPWTVLLLIALVMRCFESFKDRQSVSTTSVIEAADHSTKTLNYRSARLRSMPRPFFAPASDKRFWFVVIWSMLPVLLLSVPSGKHHHYLVPCIAPWATLSAVAGIWIVRRITRAEPGANGVADDAGTSISPRLCRGLVVAVIVLGLSYGVVQSTVAATTDHTLADTAFLIRARDEVPADAPLYIDGKLGPPGNLDFFRTQFYSRDSAVLLHNLSFLRDEKITTPVVYLICRTKEEPVLSTLGIWSIVDQSKQSHEERDDKAKAVFGKFTLYKLTFFPGLKRYPVPAKVTSLQAMERAPGPWCGPAMK